MNYRYFLVIFPYLVSAGITIWVGIIAWRRRTVHAATPFALIAISEAIWTLAYILQLLSTHLSDMLFWNDVQFLGAVFAPLFYLGFSLNYNYRDFPMSRFKWKYLLPITMLVLLLVWTDGYTHLFRSNPFIQSGNILPKLVFADGPAFGVYTIYAYSLIILASLFLLVNYMTAPQLYRIQVATVLIAILIPWITSIVTATGIIEIELQELTPITFGVSNLIVAWALFRFRLFDIVPIARETLIEKLPDAILVLDEQKRIIDANPAAQLITGKGIARLVGEKITGVLPFPEFWYTTDYANDQKSDEFSMRLRGLQEHFSIDANLLINSEKQQTGYLLLFRNITEQKKIMLDLRQSVALTKAVIESSLSGVFVIDREMNVIMSNSNLKAMFDLKDNWARLPGIRALDVIAQKITNPSAYYNMLERIVENPDMGQSEAFDLENGYAVELTVTPYKVENEEVGWLFSFGDITERKQAENRLREMAISDSLTGVFNRRYFFQLAQSELERSYRYHRELSLLMLDIDHFKKINDTFGHQVGDQVLEALVSRCRSSLRIFDIIGRYGGEEFVIMLPETNINDASDIAERLRQQVEGIIVLTTKGKATITISIGLTYYRSGNQMQLDQLIGQADQALYVAKEGGRNRVSVYQYQDPLPGIDEA